MKRDLELIRKILLMVESSPTGYAPDEIIVEGYTAEQIGYHAYLMIQAGLVEGSDVTNMESPGPEWRINNLTWWGHEFAEAARDESRWKKAMGIIKEKGGSITMDVLKDLLTSLMKGAFGIP